MSDRSTNSFPAARRASRSSFGSAGSSNEGHRSLVDSPSTSDGSALSDLSALSDNEDFELVPSPLDSDASSYGGPSSDSGDSHSVSDDGQHPTGLGLNQSSMTRRRRSSQSSSTLALSFPNPDHDILPASARPPGTIGCQQPSTDNATSPADSTISEAPTIIANPQDRSYHNLSSSLASSSDGIEDYQCSQTLVLERPVPHVQEGQHGKHSMDLSYGKDLLTLSASKQQELTPRAVEVDLPDGSSPKPMQEAIKPWSERNSFRPSASRMWRGVAGLCVVVALTLLDSAGPQILFGPSSSLSLTYRAYNTSAEVAKPTCPAADVESTSPSPSFSSRFWSTKKSGLSLSNEASRAPECSPPFSISASGMATSQSVASVHSPAKGLESPTTFTFSDSNGSTSANSHPANTTQRFCAFCTSLPDIRKKGKELILRDRPAELTTALARSGARFLQGIESQTTQSRGTWSGSLRSLHPTTWSGTNALPQVKTRNVLDTFKTVRDAVLAHRPFNTAPKPSMVLQRSTQGLRRLQRKAVFCKQRASSVYNRWHSKVSAASRAVDLWRPTTNLSFHQSLRSLQDASFRSTFSVLKRVIQHEKALQQRASDLFTSQCQEYLQNIDTAQVDRAWMRRLLPRTHRSKRPITEEGVNHTLQRRLCREATRAARRGHHARTWLKDVAAHLA